jgi:hypothetical protein
VHLKILPVSLPANNDLVPVKLHCPKINNEIFAGTIHLKNVKGTGIILTLIKEYRVIPA